MLRPDDRVLGPTHVVMWLVIPILVGAGTMLYALPDATERLWAWPMGPPMTALAVGGGYLAGGVLFAWALRQSAWHTVGVAFLAATPLTVLLLVATLLHWDLFTHDHPSFWAWFAVYLVTPVVLPAIWWRNRREDPGVSPPGSVRVPRWVRTSIALAGAAQLVVTLALFASPGLAADVWPWEVTPLTTRTLCAFLAFIATIWLVFAFEDRWSALRLPVGASTVGLALIALGVPRASDDLVPGTPRTVFLFALGGTLVALIALQVAMEAATRLTARRCPPATSRGARERSAP